MCLLLIAHRHHPDYALVLAANRDEFYNRPTRPLTQWEDAPHVFAGRDERSGGTWLGMTLSGRLGAITNFRDPKVQLPDARSRGELVSGFLAGNENPLDYLENVRRMDDQYNGFNLMVGTPEHLCYYSNRGGEIISLSPGIFGLSNHLLDTPWPKVVKSKASMARLLGAENADDPQMWFKMLSDTDHPPDSALPDTGVGLEWERLLSSIFIRSDGYGTLSSALITITSEGAVRFTEKTHAIPGISRACERTLSWTLTPSEDFANKGHGGPVGQASDPR